MSPLLIVTFYKNLLFYQTYHFWSSLVPFLHACFFSSFLVSYPVLTGPLFLSVTAGPHPLSFPFQCLPWFVCQSPCWHQYCTSKQWGSELAQVCLNSGFRCCPWPGHFGQSWLQVCISSNETLDFSQPEHSSGLPQVFYLNWDSAALNHTHPFYLCRGNWQSSLYGLAFTTWGFSSCCLSLHIFKFVQSMLPEMGKKIFPFTWCLVPPISNWFLQINGEHTTSAEIPKPVLAYEFPAELASILFVSYVLL